MAAYKLIILDPAIQELEEGCLFYNKRLAGLGFEFEVEIFVLLELLKDNPFLFPIKFAHIREAVVKRFPYVINYEVDERLIIVSAIFQTQQSPNKKIKRKRK